HEHGVRQRPSVRSGHPADEPAQADPDPEQVEQRLEEPGHEHDPGPPVVHDVALDDPARPATEPERRQDARGQPARCRHGYSTRARRNVTSAAAVPAAMYAPSTARCTIAASGWTVPSANVRLSSTPCHSGVTHAIGRTTSGSWSIGKNVPENRNRGVIPNRNIALKPWSLRCVAENATIGQAKAMPVRTATWI